MVFSLLLAAALALTTAAEAAQAQAPVTHAQAAQAANEGRNAEALQAFQQLAARNPEDHEARLWIARLHVRMGRQNLAEGVFRSVMLEDPSRVEARLGVASALLARDEPVEALEVLEGAAKVSPNNDEVIALQGRAEALAGHDLGAIGYFERALAISPTEPRLLDLEGARRSHLHRIEIRGGSEQFSDVTQDSRIGDVAVNLRLNDTLRVTGRGQVQRKFGFSDARGGAGLDWRMKPATTVRVQALVGPDNLVLPEFDLVGEAEHTYAGVTWTGTARYFGFIGANETILSPAVDWMVTDRLSMRLRYALSFTNVSEVPSVEAGQSLHIRPAYQLRPRVWLQGGYAFGVETFENFSIDRLGDFRAHTASAGLRFTTPSLTTIAVGYEHQWRQQEVNMGRATLSLVQSF